MTMDCNEVCEIKSQLPNDVTVNFNLIAFVSVGLNGGDPRYIAVIKDRTGKRYFPNAGSAIAAQTSGFLIMQFTSQDPAFPAGFFQVEGETYDFEIVDQYNNPIKFLVLKRCEKIRFTLISGNSNSGDLLLTESGCICTD